MTIAAPDLAELLAAAAGGLGESIGLIAVGVLLERSLLDGRRAALRAWVWAIVSLHLCLVPLVWALDRLGFTAPWSTPVSGALTTTLSKAFQLPVDTLSGHATHEVAATPYAGSFAIVLALWCATAVGRCALLVHRHAAARRALLAVTTPAPRSLVHEADTIARALGLKRAPRLRLHFGDASAFLFGFRRPLLVLPAALEDDERRRAALWHECMHLRRRDPLSQLTWEALRCLWWFHPLLGLAQQHATGARELACDAAVARALGEGRESYHRALLCDAAGLLSAAETRARGPHEHSTFGPLTLGWSSAPALIRVRLEALATDPREDRCRQAVAVMALAGLAALMLVTTTGNSQASARVAAQDDLPAWWSDAELASAEAARWRERQAGLGCTTGRLIFLRALALERATSPVSDLFRQP